MSSEDTTDVNPKTALPGWPETVAGIVAMAAVGFGLPIVASNQLDLTSPLGGAFLACLSGVAGLAGFAAAAALRRRSWQSFGIHRTTARWLWLGVGTGR
ncbi:hypothetical protein [Promicromonospora panici]|uniref:hypothetical protein n=1 Tax=Promicromonospora panici TaxID=2219658 RepID=UPI001A92F8D0|nr:hypothetical protein [Promicromonospora panici]